MATRTSIATPIRLAITTPAICPPLNNLLEDLVEDVLVAEVLAVGAGVVPPSPQYEGPAPQKLCWLQQGLLGYFALQSAAVVHSIVGFVVGCFVGLIVGFGLGVGAGVDLGEPDAYVMDTSDIHTTSPETTIFSSTTATGSPFLPRRSAALSNKVPCSLLWCGYRWCPRVLGRDVRHGAMSPATCSMVM